MTAEKHWEGLPTDKLRALYERELKRAMSGDWVAESPITIRIMGRVLRARLKGEQHGTV